ncbi:ATP-binding protein [Halomicronema sp. CCY15110]|uniref:ATP-binding protein n=1 Tax=Halomicronema sp. CCY15110 TaxID=2767773 RepID=UPI0019510EB8|nr:ATP-binding protein [Halomicronema sp. CCY15110]
MVTFKDPEEVFTPRSPKVNEVMYISRPDLEESLIGVLRGTKHLIVHGESGSGKSWLYKKVLKDKGIKYEVINLANAARRGSINQAFQDFLDSQTETVRTGYSESKNVTLGILGANSQLDHTNHFTSPPKEPFEELLKRLNSISKNKKSILVLDNLESILDDKTLLSELANLVTLLDDEIYSQYKVRFIIVGVPNDIGRYFSATPSFTTVDNRLSEVKEVFRFTERQTKELVFKGFVQELGLIQAKDPFIEEVSEHVVWVTDRIPQRIHEYCAQLAWEAVDKKRDLMKSDLKVADRKWLEASLNKAYLTVAASMNEKVTKVQRKNQVIYTLGQTTKSGFRYSDIEAELKQYFPRSTEDTQLNISGVLSSLAAQEHPLIRRSPKGDVYVFSNPVYKMCIRCMLKISDKDEKIIQRELHTLNDLDEYLY